MIGTRATPAVAWGIGGAESLQPAVVGPCSGERQLGVGDLSGGETGAEGRRLLAGHRVSVREDHLAGDAVGIQLLVADVGVVGAPQSLGVVALPLLDVVTIHLFHQSTMVVPLGRPLVELAVVSRLQVLAVVLHLQSGVGVR